MREQRGSQSAFHHHHQEAAAHDADDGGNRSWEASENDVDYDDYDDDKKMKKNCRQKRQLMLHRI